MDLPADVSDSGFRRMVAERSRGAREWRSQGAEQAERSRADADRRRTEIIAEAYRTSQEVRGEGDGKASETYAKAFDKNKVFYAVYRSLEAYRASFKVRYDVLVVDPIGDFFKYFNDANSRR